MIQVKSTYTLEQIESAICRAAQHHGARVVSTTRFRPLLSGESSAPERAVTFTLVHTEIYRELLDADVRFASLLPCRIAALQHGDGVMLETISPASFSSLLEGASSPRWIAPLETLLREIIEEMAEAPSIPAQKARSAASTLGAREGQGRMAGSIPQRVDALGTKIEDIAGTGKVDAPGG